MDVNKIPEKLKSQALWCVWESGKIPCNPRTGEKAKANSPETFSDFETAYNALEIGCCNGSKYEGLGLLIYNGFCAIDIDHCIDEKGNLSDMAKDIITKMGSYTEISPSGTGIHIIFTMSDFQYDKVKYYINNRKIGLEVYISGCTGKYVTITGNTINDNVVTDNPPALQEILDKYMQKEQLPPSKSDSPVIFSARSDEEYLKIGLEKGKNLKAYWRGERPLKSESENDMGFLSHLLYWTNGNIDLAIKAFRASPYASQKDPEHKKKIERPDYLLNTAKSCKVTTTAAQKDAEYHAARQPKQEQVSSQALSSRGLKLVSAQKLQETNLPPVEYLVEDILPQGTSLLTAAPKIGKSWLVLDMGLKIAAGERFFNKGTKQTGVLYLALEDSYTRLQERMNKVLNHNPPPEHFYFLAEAPNLENGLLTELETTLTMYPQIKLIIIDTLQKIRGQALPRESAYQQDYREMGMIKKFADKHKISIFLVHHNRKMKDDEDPFNMVSGTNGLMGAADTMFMITKQSRNDESATLYITGRDVMQSGIVIRFDSTTCRWDVVGDIKDIEKQEYDSNPIVKVIKELVLNGPGHSWIGTATQLIKEGVKMKMPIPGNAQNVGYEIKKLIDSLLKYDDIYYEPISNGTAGTRHHFYKNEKIIKATIVPDDEDDDIDEDVDF